MGSRLVASTLPLTVIPFVIGCSDGGTQPEGPSWSLHAPLPVPRTDHAVVALGGKMYALGGFSGSTLARVDEYDPATDTWVRRADMPTARREFAAGVINERIYVAAGMSFSDPDNVTYIAATEEYDPATETWTSREPNPTIEGPNAVYTNVHISGGVANGRLYVVVFSVNLPGFAATYEYNPVTNSWAAKAPVPFSYQRLTTTEVGGKLYVLASGQGGVNLASYDPIDDTWIIRAPLPGLAWAGLVGGGGKVYAVGGVTMNANGEVTRVLTSVNEYDPAGNRWQARPSLGIARHSAAGVELGGALYVTGGSASTNLVAPTPVAAVEGSILP